MRDRRVEIRLTGEEYDRLCSLAEGEPGARSRRSGRAPLSSFIRSRALAPAGRGGDLRAEIRELSYQIRKEGVNINQAVHRINAGARDSRDIRRILEAQERIESLEAEILALVEGPGKEA